MPGPQGFATEEDYRTDTEDTFVNKKPSSIRSKCIPASSASRRAVPRRARACSVFAGGRRPLAHGSGHGVAAWMRCDDGGLRSSRKVGRIGRGHRLPPQLEQIPIKWPSTQRRQAGALVCADHRLRRVGRKIDVATFAVGAQLEHTPGLPDDDRRHTPAALSSFVGSAPVTRSGAVGMCR